MEILVVLHGSLGIDLTKMPKDLAEDLSSFQGLADERFSLMVGIRAANKFVERSEARLGEVEAELRDTLSS